MAKPKAKLLLESNFSKAERIVKDPDALERLLQRLEEKLKQVPIAGDALSNIPVLASMVRSYVCADYPNIPLGTMIAIVSALIYFLSPIDLIPDAIPGVGYVDDAAVIAACLAMIQSDITEYKTWQSNR